MSKDASPTPAVPGAMAMSDELLHDLDEVEEYFAQRADIREPGIPNEAMRHQVTIKHAMEVITDLRAQVRECEMALNEAVTNGRWSGGPDYRGEWCITSEVYDTCKDALERTPQPAPTEGGKG